MAIGLVGRKAGMTRVFTEDGDSVPVTVIEIEPNRVTYVRTPEVDGYAAVQVTTGAAKRSTGSAEDLHIRDSAQQMKKCRTLNAVPTDKSLPDAS